MKIEIEVESTIPRRVADDPNEDARIAREFQRDIEVAVKARNLKIVRVEWQE